MLRDPRLLLSSNTVLTIGTLISISAHEIHEALAPIYERLEDEHSLLRRSNDVSMLAHALLDVSVDLSVEITQAFDAEILKAEAKVLVHAQVSSICSSPILIHTLLAARARTPPPHYSSADPPLPAPTVLAPARMLRPARPGRAARAGAGIIQSTPGHAERERGRA